MKEEQFGKLDKCHFEYKMEQRCEEEVVEARTLLGSSRFDLYAILLYIDHKVRGVHDMTYARNVYKERTRSITGYRFAEQGNDNKQSLQDFFKVLDGLIDDFQNDRYDENRKLIPVDKDYELFDGAHRVACAAYFGKKVRVLHFLDEKVTRMTSQDLIGKLMPVSIADAMALEATRWHDDLFMLFLWPKSFDYPERQVEAKKLIYEKLDVVYEKNATMTLMGVRNLMVQIYGHMPWVGNIENDFDSTYKKAEEVWSSHGKCCYILARASSMEYVLNVKAQIREIFQIGLASIHSTDNMRETMLAVNTVFNPNSFHFINKSTPTKYKRPYKLLIQFKRAITEEGLSTEKFIIDSSMVLSIFGAREAGDLDYYSLYNSNHLFDNIENIEEHDVIQRGYYDMSVEDLIIVPANYFTFNEIKFVSLERLLLFKQNRYGKNHDPKDAADIKIIKMLLSDKESKWRMKMIAFSVTFKRWKRLFRRWYYETRLKLLKALGIYDILKNLYKKLKK